MTRRYVQDRLGGVRGVSEREGGRDGWVRGREGGREGGRYGWMGERERGREGGMMEDGWMDESAQYTTVYHK